MFICEECAERTHPFGADVERLAEMIARQDTDAALTALHELLPRLAPLPALVKRRLADRSAQPATRAA